MTRFSASSCLPPNIIALGLQTHNKESSAEVQSCGKHQETSGKLEKFKKAYTCAHVHTEKPCVHRDYKFSPVLIVHFSFEITCTAIRPCLELANSAHLHISGCFIAWIKGTYLCRNASWDQVNNKAAVGAKSHPLSRPLAEFSFDGSGRGMWSQVRVCRVWRKTDDLLAYRGSTYHLVSRQD